jgi:hypothetical protein
VNRVMKLWIPESVENFLTSWVTLSFSRRTQGSMELVHLMSAARLIGTPCDMFTNSKGRDTHSNFILNIPTCSKTFLSCVAF